MNQTFSVFALVLSVSVASAAPKADKFPLMIKVVKSETLPVSSSVAARDGGCNQVDYSPDCLHASNNLVLNTMVVDANDGSRFAVACKKEVQWSKCAALPVGESFRARVEGKRLVILYSGPGGRQRKQEYDVLTVDHDTPPRHSPDTSGTLPKE